MPFERRPADLLHSVRAHRLVPVVVVGLGGGLLGAAYVALLHLLQRWLWPDGHTFAVQAAVLLGAGLVLAVGSRLLGPTGDVELLVDNIHVLGGAESVRYTRALVPLSLVSIAAGGPVGPEAPLVQTTGTFGSTVARRFAVDQDELRVLTITGMAAGFTVLFGAPLGGAFFALEILHRRGLQYYEALVPALVGSLSGYAVFVMLTNAGLAPVWRLPDVGELHPTDLAWAVGCAALGAALAAAFVGMQIVARRIARLLPPFVRPIAAAAVLVGLAWWSPFALTYGEHQADLVLAGTMTLGALAIAVVAKLAGATVALSTEWKGGFVITLFFLGMALGMAVHTVAPSSNTAVVVSACVVGLSVGVTKTPVGSALVVAEMTGLSVLPTTILAAVVALVLTRPITLIESQRARPAVAP